MFAMQNIRKYITTRYSRGKLEPPPLRVVCIFYPNHVCFAT
nr:MAG TPA: hypothetical protein [Bacteriophage sp.]